MTRKKAARKRPAAKQAKKAARKAVRRPAAAKAKSAASKKKPVKKKAAAVRKPAKKKAAARKSVKKKAAARARTAPKKAAARKKPAAKKKAAARRPAAQKKRAAAARRRPAAARKPAPRKPAAAKPAKKIDRLADQAETQSRVEEMLREGPPEAKAYMSAGQKKWFRALLEEMLSEIRSEAERTNQELLMQEKDLADELDRAHSEYRFVVDLRENERISQLQVKISHSLRMLESGDYGICEDCGVQIGIKRMASRPMATKCIDCKNFQEDLEKNAL